MKWKFILLILLLYDVSVVTAIGINASNQIVYVRILKKTEIIEFHVQSLQSTADISVVFLSVSNDVSVVPVIGIRSILSLQSLYITNKKGIIYTLCVIFIWIIFYKVKLFLQCNVFVCLSVAPFHNYFCYIFHFDIFCLKCCLFVIKNSLFHFGFCNKNVANYEKTILNQHYCTNFSIFLALNIF